MTVAIERTRARSLPSYHRSYVILNQLDRMPIPPVISSGLLARAVSDLHGDGDVIRLLDSDAALRAAVSRLTEHLPSGVRDESLDASRVVSLLGVNQSRRSAFVCLIVRAISSHDVSEHGMGFRGQVWQHSLAVACAAELICEQISASVSAADAFLAGLVHDVGKVALATCWPKSYARIVERVQREHTCVCDLEEELFGLDHTVAGKRLAARWRLPRSLVDCVWLHHQGADSVPSSLTNAPLLRVVQLADEVVRRERIGFSGYQAVADTEALADRLGLSPDDLAHVTDQLEDRIEPLFPLMDPEQGWTAAPNSGSSTARGQSEYRLSPPEQEVAVHTQRVSAVGMFLEALHNGPWNATLGDVCRAAARSVRASLDADVSVALMRWSDAHPVHVACSTSFLGGSADRRPETLDGRVLDRLEVCMPANQLLSIAARSAWTRAPQEFEAIWERCVGDSPRFPLWMLSGGLERSEPPNGLLAVVLVAMPKPGPHRGSPHGLDWESLADTITVTAETVGSRAECERVNEELVALNRRLHHTQQEKVRDRTVSIIAEMAAGAAHELNNPLAVISGRAQMLLSRSVDKDSAQWARAISEQAHRAAGIVTDLMAFAKPDPPEPASVPLGELLEPLCQRWRSGSGLPGNRLALRLVDSSVTVYADASQVADILDAIVQNAVQAVVPETGLVQINSPSRASDKTVRIAVEDNGVGMTPDVLAHVFDPFYSHRAAGRNRGLGLSRAQRLAENNGGRLSLESKPGVGTIATLELPADPTSR